MAALLVLLRHSVQLVENLASFLIQTLTDVFNVLQDALLVKQIDQLCAQHA